MPWDLTNDRPIYLQLKEHIQHQILAGEYAPGDRLPSVRDLACDAAVNPNTMQKALAELERDGLIITKRTSGRTVCTNNQLLSDSRHELARSEIHAFILSMSKLGFDQNEIINCFTQEFNKISPNKGKELTKL